MNTLQIDKFRKKFGKEEPHWIKNLLLLVQLIQHGGSVNLRSLSVHVSKFLGNTTSKTGSHYQRLVRVFRASADDTGSKFSEYLQKMNQELLPESPQYAIIDGSSWKRGERWYHFMTLGLSKGLSFYLADVLDLERRGNSHHEDREDLLRPWISSLKKGVILLCDREYIGKEWFNWLKLYGLQFVIRVKKDDYLKELKVSQQELERRARKSKRKKSKTTVKLARRTYDYVVVYVPESEEKYYYYISHTKHPYKEVESYRKRWQIETAFKQLKSNGYNWEELNFKDSRKVELMNRLLFMAYNLSIHEGVKQTASEGVKYKKINGKVYLAESIFKKGYEHIVNITIRFELFLEYLWLAIHEKITKKLWKKIHV